MLRMKKYFCIAATNSEEFAQEKNFMWQLEKMEKTKKIQIHEKCCTGLIPTYCLYNVEYYSYCITSLTTHVTIPT